MTTTFCDDVLQHLSRLESFARRLAGNRSFADDLVQDTLLRAITHADQFQPGTNLRAWLMTILRNTYFNEKRRTQRLVALDVESPTMVPTTSGGQETHMHMRDVESRFACLPATQREALILVGANGYSYDRAAEIAGCPEGTMKSRVSRARLQLQHMLDDDKSIAWNRAPHSPDFAHLEKKAA